MPKFSAFALRPLAKPISKAKRALLILVIFLLLCGFAALGRFAIDHHKTNQAKAVAKQFVAALNASDLHQAYELTSRAVRASASEAEFSGVLSDLKASQPVYENETIQLAQGRATYEVDVEGLQNTRSGSPAGTFTIELLYEDNAWRINSVHVR